LGDSFRELIVWQKAVKACTSVYRCTEAFPRQEVYGLVNQMRRAAVSVASNIAEGYGRRSTGEYLQFLGNARGSNAELQTQIVIARELGFGSTDLLADVERQTTEVGKMLHAMLMKLEQR
jgi:four helix bundle protein